MKSIRLSLLLLLLLLAGRGNVAGVPVLAADTAHLRLVRQLLQLVSTNMPALIC